MSGWAMFGAPVRGRACGSCKACCTLTPATLHFGEEKPAGKRCRHLKSSGCGIYAGRPQTCAAWSCRWLFDPRTADMLRPDRSGYIIDPMLDVLLVEDRRVTCVQVWADPKRPDAHRDPALRAFLVTVDLPAIIRFENQRSIIIAPPSYAASGLWYEVAGGQMISRKDMAAKLVAAESRYRPAHSSATLMDHGGVVFDLTTDEVSL